MLSAILVHLPSAFFVVQNWDRDLTLLVQVFDGVPPPYDKMKRMVIPEALRITRLRPGRRSVLSDQCSARFCERAVFC